MTQEELQQSIDTMFREYKENPKSNYSDKNKFFKDYCMAIINQHVKQELERVSSLKRCPKCSIDKPLSEYYVSKFTKDGFHSWCKDCDKAQRKERHSKNKDVENSKNKEWTSKNIERKIAQQAEWKKNNIERVRRKDLENKHGAGSEHYQARLAVNNAIKLGRIIKPTVCFNQDINCDGALQAHHHLGYDKENWLKVWWVCRKHHWEIHNELREEQRKRAGL